VSEVTHFFEDSMCFHEPQRRYMVSYWDADYRTDGPRDAEGRLQLPTLKKLYSMLDKEDSFEATLIGRVRRDLMAKLFMLRKERVERDYFDLFVPPIPGDEPAPLSIGSITSWSYDSMLAALTDEELEELSVGTPDALREELRKAIYRVIETLTMLLIGAWFGETKLVFTGVQIVDDWMAEAQEGMAEFSLPKRFSEELIRRHRYRAQTLNRETGTVVDPRGALEKMIWEPLDQPYTLDDFERMYVLADESNGW